MPNTRSNHRQKCAVHAGTKKSVNGLKKENILKRAKTSKAVKLHHKAMCISKKKHEAGKKNLWTKAVKKARQKLDVKGFQAVKKGTRLYKEVLRIYEEEKTKRGEKKTWVCKKRYNRLKNPTKKQRLRSCRKGYAPAGAMPVSRQVCVETCYT